jgi:hypothetical protein
MTRRAGAEVPDEFVFEKNDPRFVVHAVIGDEADDGALRDKASDPLVEGVMKSVGGGFARRVQVLNIVR